MCREYRIPVRDSLRTGSNTLSIMIQPAIPEAERRARSSPYVVPSVQVSSAVIWVCPFCAPVNASGSMQALHFGRAQAWLQATAGFGSLPATLAGIGAHAVVKLVARNVAHACSRPDVENGLAQTAVQGTMLLTGWDFWPCRTERIQRCAFDW